MILSGKFSVAENWLCKKIYHVSRRDTQLDLCMEMSAPSNHELAVALIHLSIDDNEGILPYVLEALPIWASVQAIKKELKDFGFKIVGGKILPAKQV